MNKLSYKNVIELNELMSRLVNKGLTVENIIKLVEFKEELTSKFETYQGAFKEIMSSFDVPESMGRYSWGDFENAPVITEKVTELLNSETELEHSNFLEGNEYISLTDGLNLESIVFLKKFLKK